MRMMTGRRISTARGRSIAACFILGIGAAPLFAADPPYRIIDVTTITFDLPKDFVPASLPVRPLDENLRVGLVLPAFDPERSAWFLAAREREGGTVTGVNKLILNFAEPTSAVLPRIFGRLFPRTEILRSSPEIGKYDLVLRFALTSRITDNPDGTFRGAEVTGAITAVGSNGQALSKINATGRADAAKSTFWSGKTRGKAVGVPALEAMLGYLVRNLVVDQPLNTYIRGLAAERARPSELETTAKFDDSSGLFPNGRLDGGESARLVFKVRNQGAGPAFAVRLRVSSATKEISIPNDTVVGDVPPGGETEVSIAITADIGLETAVLRLPVETLEKRGYAGRPLVLEVATEKLRRPNLEITDITLNDRGGRSRGDGNGQPSNGETLEAIVRIRNSGPGEAAGVVLTVASGAGGVELPELRVGVPAIPVNGAGKASVLVSVPVAFEASDLSLTFLAVEARGPEVAQASKTEVWQLQLKKPVVEVPYRLYDGSSAGSRGDRDGVANNGERLELVLTPINRGALEARDVRISLVSQQPGVTLSQTSFEVDDLPARAEGAEQRVGLEISRTLGRDAAIDKLLLTVTITQRDFAPREEPILLSFQARHPELVANVTSLNPLIEGGSAVLLLELSNKGLLTAEGVQVEVASDNQGLELLDELGAPTRKLHLDVGTVGAGMSVPQIQIKAHVKRNISATGTLLKVMALQKDFPSVEKQATLRIEREEAAVISAVPPSSAGRPFALSVASPANVSFRRYETGDHVAEEAIILRFEVQSQSNLETVRLQQNGRAMPLAEPVHVPGSHLWQYEQPVHLADGENDFEVVVVTAEGIRNNRILSLIRDREEGRVWVAVVGVSKYSDDRITPLKFAKEDATAVLDYYRDRFGLPEGQMIQLLDEQATLTNIKRTLGTELVSKANNPNDTVILYFAGHGKKEPDAGSPDSDGFSKYILPYDANPSDLFGSALSMEEIVRILQRLRPERVALIIDSCFSGAAGGGRTLFDPNEGQRSAVTEEFLSRMAGAGQGRVVLTASGANELARERADLGHGIFTYFLLQGLRGEADDDGDGRIDVDEIYKFVSRKVIEATGGQQRPMKKLPSLVGTLILGRTSVRVGQKRE